VAEPGRQERQVITGHYGCKSGQWSPVQPCILKLLTHRGDSLVVSFSARPFDLARPDLAPAATVFCIVICCFLLYVCVFFCRHGEINVFNNYKDIPGILVKPELVYRPIYLLFIV